MKNQKHAPNQSNKYADLAMPQRQLDFHTLGLLTETQIIEELESFLQKTHQENLKKVLIITGKGLHSQDGRAVIKPLVQAHLRTHNLVKNFSFAPINQGGEGAMMVMLN